MPVKRRLRKPIKKTKLAKRGGLKKKSKERAKTTKPVKRRRYRRQTKYYRPPRKHLWEAEMDKPPRQVDVLREVILSKVSYYQPKIFHELHQEILDDYGPITDRAVYRNLKWLIDQGRVKRVLFEEDPCYLRVGSWKEATDCQTDVDTEAHAA